MDNTQKSPNVLSLCSGYGGLEIGLERAIGKVSVLAHVEIEAFAITNLVNKMETGKMAPVPIWTDLKTFRAEIFRGMVDILTGGYPCQPFSTAGKRQGTKDPRHLWPFIKNIIEECQPRWCFFENVEGHISKGITEVLADLERMGYEVEAGIFSAVEVGAPHQRKRVFILANSDKSGRIEQRRTKPTQKEYEAIECGSRWPTRPGQTQYEWEKPRTVANTTSPNGGQLRERESSSIRNASTNESRKLSAGQKTSQSKNRFTKSGMGRTINGIEDRTDRLRLLGNGVVPQTAEKAFRILYGKITDPLR